MKPMIAYVVWNKFEMFSLYRESLLRSFPARTPIHFVLDHPVDDCEAQLQAQLPRLAQYNYPVTYETTATDCYEVGGHNLAIERFLASDCDLLIAPQDDQRFILPPLPVIKRILAAVPKLGVIGGRDGYWPWLRQMISASSSDSQGGAQRLMPGQWQVAPFLNSGPVVYTREVVQAVGKADPRFHAFYWLDEYCYRALEAGFTNVVADLGIINEVLGRRLESTLYIDTTWASDDRALLDALTPNRGKYTWSG